LCHIGAIVTNATWTLLLRVEGIEETTLEIDYAYLAAGEGLSELPVNQTAVALGKRDCNSNDQFVVDKQQRFVDWDVQMSPVVVGTGIKCIDITISKSFTISNSITAVAPSTSARWPASSVPPSTSTTRAPWTTQQGYAIRGTVDEGFTGVVVMKPWTNRRYGRTFQGCVGSLRQTGTFMADSHVAGSYEGVTWVGGAITACLKRQSWIPLFTAMALETSDRRLQLLDSLILSKCRA
jgi:hypothetical protein